MSNGVPMITPEERGIRTSHAWRKAQARAPRPTTAHFLFWFAIRWFLIGGGTLAVAWRARHDGPDVWTAFDSVVIVMLAAFAIRDGIKAGVRHEA